MVNLKLVIGIGYCLYFLMILGLRCSCLSGLCLNWVYVINLLIFMYFGVKFVCNMLLELVIILRFVLCKYVCGVFVFKNIVLFGCKVIILSIRGVNKLMLLGYWFFNLMISWKRGRLICLVWVIKVLSVWFLVFFCNESNFEKKFLSFCFVGFDWNMLMRGWILFIDNLIK